MSRDSDENDRPHQSSAARRPDGTAAGSLQYNIIIVSHRKILRMILLALLLRVLLLLANTNTDVLTTRYPLAVVSGFIPSSSKSSTQKSNNIAKEEEETKLQLHEKKEKASLVSYSVEHNKNTERRWRQE